MKISKNFDSSADIVLYEGSCLDLLKSIPDDFFQLIVTSPPYNIGKEYESKKKIDSDRLGLYP